MSLSDLASLGSFVSGVAVVITLVFLLLQFRQANLNQRALMQQMRSARGIDTLLKQTDPYLSEIINGALQNDRTLNETQLRSWLELQIASLTNWEDSFLQKTYGTLDREIADADTQILKVMASFPAFRVAWRIMRNTFSNSFRQHVDDLMKEAKVRNFPPLTATWQRLMADELNAVNGS